MKIYYIRLADGSIGANTTDEDEALRLGLNLVTDSEIVIGYDGKLYLSGEEPKRPPQVSDYDTVLEQHLFDERNARGFTTREPSLYVNSTNARWQQDAVDWIAHVDAVMEYALEVENRVAAGESVPTVEEFKAGLPVIRWSYNEV